MYNEIAVTPLGLTVGRAEMPFVRALLRVTKGR